MFNYFIINAKQGCTDETIQLKLNLENIRDRTYISDYIPTFWVWDVELISNCKVTQSSEAVSSWQVLMCKLTTFMREWQLDKWQDNVKEDLQGIKNDKLEKIV